MHLTPGVAHSTLKVYFLNNYLELTFIGKYV